MYVLYVQVHVQLPYLVLCVPRGKQGLRHERQRRHMPFRKDTQF